MVPKVEHALLYWSEVFGFTTLLQTGFIPLVLQIILQKVLPSLPTHTPACSDRGQGR